MNEQAMRFRFGIFVLAALILLAILTILFGGFPNYFKGMDTYTIVFANAPHVAKGTPVLRSGVRIGEVRSVKLDNDTGKVVVEIRVDDQYSLPKADRPTLVQGLIGGDSSISFLPPPANVKNPDMSPVPPGAVLQGQSPPEPGELVKETVDLVKPAKETLDEIRKVFTGIDQMRPLINDTLTNLNAVSKMAKDADLARTSQELAIASRNWGKVGERLDVMLKVNEDKINRSVDRMEETLKRLNELLGDDNQKNLRDTLKNAKNGSKEFEELMKDSRVTVRQANESLKRADEALADFQKAMKPLGERGPRVLKNLDESTEDLSKTLKDIREIIRVVARSDGTIQKLLSDPSLYNNLNDSAEMTAKILPRLNHALSDFEIFADKLARHPELIGLYGVVHPSNGLKDAPTPYHIYPMRYGGH